ncbi:hypothetical protein H257_18659 [Aphanomyces astaci]|uniref:Uncharacterized protein n=1 Tax=Aphanomyces astaci TaxID=112090 RepID=W4FCK7_APHAT|nr:hypothetical protein H257_18659 [Aphanomyces astaci]ETV64463.1 hypothetical protein H257_18659 [Aphanomyces astaci]|eukprot:XP_009846055.1 hypothetical protein H257_18659 [Aphanomyces astaci]
MERVRSIWKETKSVTVVETVDVAEVSLDNAVICAARVVCVAGQAVSLDASFDSSADQSVVHPATLAKLKKQGRNVLVTKLKTPIKVMVFVGPAHTVTEEATMDLRFEKDAGPAVLVRLSMVGFAEAEPKLTVDYLVAAVQPLAVRARVKELMKLNENRSLKKDARDFKRWPADCVATASSMAAAVPATAKPDKLPAATKTPKTGKAPKVVAVVKEDKIP